MFLYFIFLSFFGSGGVGSGISKPNPRESKNIRNNKKKKLYLTRVNFRKTQTVEKNTVKSTPNTPLAKKNQGQFDPEPIHGSGQVKTKSSYPIQ